MPKQQPTRRKSPGSLRAALTLAVLAAAFPAVLPADVNTLVSAPVGPPEIAGSANLVWDRNGRYGTFVSNAENLVSGQDSSSRQIFLYDRIEGRVRLVSHRPGQATVGAETSADDSTHPSISADGNWVVYSSKAPDLVAGQLDSNGELDVFLWSRETGTTLLVSHRADAAAVAGNGASQTAPTKISLSDDGRFVAYSSLATDLVAGQSANAFEQVYLFDRESGASTLVSHAASGPLQSGGDRSAFLSQSGGRAISGDGRWVGFTTLATNLSGAVIDANGQFDAYLWDRLAAPAGSLRLLSRRPGSPIRTGNSSSSDPTVAADGSAVAFTSGATNLQGTISDSNAGADVFHYDRLADVVTLVSHDALSTTTAGNGIALFPSISGDGRRVAFESRATNHVLNQLDGNGESDVFLWQGSVLLLMSHRPGSARETANGSSATPLIAEDGGGVAFTSDATDLVAGIGDSNGGADAFFRPRGGPGAILLSHLPSGAATGDQRSEVTSVVLAGALAAVLSSATDLVEQSINPSTNVYAHGSLLMADGFESGDLSAWSQVLP